MKSKLALFFLLACGGSAPAAETPKPHEETAAQKRSKEFDALLEEEPKVPFHVENTKTLHASRDCGQGPFRVDGKVLGTDFGEQIEVYACASHSLSGRSQITMDGKTDASTQSFGWSKSGNDRCHASATELAHVGGDAGATTSTTSTSTSSGTASKPSGITTAAEKLDDSTIVIADTDECPKDTTKVRLFSESFTSSYGAYRKAGTPFRVEIWSDEPLDLKDVTFVLRQHRVDASMTSAAWTELQKKREVWFTRLAMFEKSHDDMFVHDDGGTPPPPPARAETQSPKPSVHAAWIPGYFHRDGASWLWIAGFWRVPDEDVKKELTTVAPTAPPPVRDESAARASVVVASHDLVWTEGHWQWDGARWVWVDGAWRLPPEHGVTWQAPAWRPRGTTFIFVPGGWGRRH